MTPSGVIKAEKSAMEVSLLNKWGIFNSFDWRVAIW
jgi:hypothetical protein